MKCVFFLFFVLLSCAWAAQLGGNGAAIRVAPGGVVAAPVSDYRSVSVCEGDTASVSCPSGSTIDVGSAIYGRSSRSICPGPIAHGSCALDVAALVKAQCQGKASCTFPVTNTGFNKDPCVNTYKYLDLQFRCVAGDTGVVKKCTIENPSTWGLRFRLTGAAVTPTGCKAKCVAGGGNGEFCINAPLGWCVCGTDRQPSSTQPPTQGCDVKCPGTNSECGGNIGQYSCYGKALPPPESAKCEVATINPATMWECQASGDPHWYASHWPAFRHWMLQGRYLILGQARGAYSIQFYGSFVVCNMIGAWSATCLHNMYLTLATPTTGPVTITFDAANNKGKPLLNGNLLALPAYNFYGACIFAPPSATFYGRGGGAVGVDNPIIVRWFETMLLLGFQPNSAFGTIGLFQWWFPQHTGQNPPNIDGVCDSFVHAELERFEPDAKYACEQLDIYFIAHGDTRRNQMSMWNMANACCKDFLCDPGAWKGCVIDACLAGSCTVNTAQKAWTINAQCSGACAKVDCSGTAFGACQSCKCDPKTVKCTDCFNFPAGMTCDDGNAGTVLDACNGQGACIGRKQDCVQFEECSDCSKTCGPNSVQTCKRTIMSPAQGSGKPCGAAGDYTKPCTVPSCGCTGMAPVPQFAASYNGACNNIAEGGSCNQNCQAGYTMATATVCKNSQYVVGICQPAGCPVPMLPANGASWGCAGQLAHGQGCVLACNAGFAPSDRLLCTMGQTNAPQCLPVGCSALPDLTNGQWLAPCATPSKDPVKVGQVCTPKCSVGYYYQGQPATCQAGNVWSANTPQIVCGAIPCLEAPPTMEHVVWAWAGGRVENGIKLGFKCSAGYVAQNPAAGAVCTFGRWKVDKDVKCVASGCLNQPVAPNKGSYPVCVNVASDGTCALTCSDGYKKTDDAVCVRGVWTNPQCVLAVPGSCDGSVKPAPPANGKWDDCGIILPNQACTVKCNPGYTPKGGLWCKNGALVSDAQCLPSRCGSPPADIPFGGWTGCGAAASGEQCQPTCTRCYTPSGNAMCQLGQWVANSPACTPTGCSQPAPNAVPNGVVNCANGVADGAACTVTCNAGYALVGALTCNLCEWSKVQCAPQGCAQAPIVVNGAYPGCANVAHGGQCNVACNAGYTVVGVATARCNLGQWTAPAQCLDLTCDTVPSPNPANGQYPTSCAGTTSGKQCQANCNTGFIVNNVATCTQGKWGGASVCIEAPCSPPPQIVSSNTTVCPLNAQGMIDSGDACAIACNDKFVLNGELRCKRGVWSVATCTAPNCRKSLQIPNGQFPAACSVNQPHGVKCQASCFAGFTLQDGPAVCTYGEWVNIPQCRPSPCVSQPGAIDHGAWIWKGAVQSGEAIGYTCQAGYRPLVLAGQAECFQGQWNVDETVVKCVPLGCANPPMATVNGKAYPATCNNVASGDYCVLSCNAGYVKTDDARCIEGKWTAPRCIQDPNGCQGPPMPAPANGKYDPCALVPDAGWCMVACEAGFVPKQNAQCNKGKFTSLGLCEETGCQAAPGMIPNGWFAKTCAGSKPGDQCVPQCNDGFEPTGFAICRAGVFNINTAQCTPKKCPTVPPVRANAQVNCQAPIADGGKCTVTCSAGYTLVGMAQCNRGVWTDYECKPNPCPAGPMVPNGSVDATCKNVDGTAGKCSVTCNTGYYIVDRANAQAICNQGTWWVPQCVPMGCTVAPSRAISFGSWSAGCAGTADGGKCAPTCQLKYVAVGFAQCNKGTWNTDNAKCQPQPCTELAPNLNDLGFYEGKCDVPAASGTTCKIGCNPGYVSNGLLTTCQAGEWINVAQCLPAQCAPLPTVEFGTWDPACGGKENSMCSLSCFKGFTIQGGPAKCWQSKWTNVPKCVEEGCPVQPSTAIENGRWVWNGAVQAGGKIGFVCATGYEQLNVNAQATCRRGVFEYDAAQVKCVPARCLNQPDNSIMGGNGTFAAGCAPAKHGSECALICITGYEKTANAKCEFGVWSRPQCIRSTANDCQGAPKGGIANGKWQSCDGIMEGRTCVLDCNKGYSKTGDAVCQAANYIAPLPTCQPNPCTEQPGPDPKNGAFPKTCQGKGHGYQCAPVCVAGFNPAGNAICNLGQWDVSAASCVASPCKGAVPTVSNGAIDCGTVGPNGVAHGAACKVTCNTGYTLDGEVRCRNGQYTQAECDPNPCATAPAIDNGRYGANCANIPDGGECQVWCNDGFMPDKPSAKCSLGAFIAPLPKCVPRPCATAPPAVTGAKWALDCAGTPDQGICALVCNAGLVRQGDAKCVRGQWDVSAAICAAAPCMNPPAAVVQFANTSCPLKNNSVASGSLCTVTCQDGYELQGQLRCMKGEWTDAKCVPKTCLTPPPIQYGAWPSSCANVAHNGLCTATCNKGYVANGVTVQCVAGTWNDTGLCSPAPCTTALPILPNLRWKNVQGRYQDGDVIYFTCDVGYQAVNSSSFAACIKGEYVIDAVDARCLPAPCNVEPSAVVVNGTYDTQCRGTAHGGKCTMFCDPGFDKTADAECVYGQWTVPKCIRSTANDCKTAPGAVANGKWGCTSTENGKWCMLECGAGYVKSADAKCVNAQYTGVGKCNPLDCVELPKPNPNFGIFPTTCNNQAHNSSCRQQCREGFVPQGSALCWLGKWDTSSASCVPAPCAGAPPTQVEFATQQCPNAPVTSGQGCSVTCNAGYSLEGQVMCTQGVWSTARCLPNPCTTAPKIANGDVAPECKAKPTSGSGGTCTAVCSEGFQFAAGPTAFVCRAGAWDQASIPKCTPIPCQAQPPRVEFGTWQCTGNNANDQCTLGCTANYNASITTVKCVGGHWQGAAAAQCNPKGCLAAPVNPANGAYAKNCAPVAHGAICALNCTNNAVKSGDAVCRYGVWSDNTCLIPQPNDCDGKPNDVAHGEFDDCQDIPHQAKCKLNCDEGYVKTDDALCNNGTYTNLATLKCNPMPCAAMPAGPAKQPGTWQCTVPQNHGGECSLNCPQGYTKSGQAICKAGKWASADAACVPNTCPAAPAAFANGQWAANCKNVPHGGSCSPQCAAGYSSVGVARCELGAWTGQYSCNPLPCTTLPVAVNGVAGKDCGNVASGKNCSITCNDGYEIAPIQWAMCNLGQWAWVPTCTEMNCKQAPAAVPQGTWSCAGKPTNAGDNCTVTCNTGYVTAQANSQCSRGQWVGVPVCEPAGCATAPANPANGGFTNATACAGADHGDSCFLQCNNNFAKTADAECEYGVWSAVECRQELPDDCKGAPNPNPQNGHFEACVEVASNSTCKLICKEGYDKKGDAVCFDGAYDVSNAICTPKPCVAGPPAAKNGNFAACANVAHGGVCALQCDGQYNRTGDAVCLHGSWDLSNALCMPPTCPPPAAVQFGSFPACTGRAKHLDQCELVCQQPYQKSGDAQCLMGEWRMPRCVEAICAAMPIEPKNGKYAANCTNVPSGQECTLWCADGYAASGDAKCRNGTWGGDVADGAPLPTCVPLSCNAAPAVQVVKGSWSCNSANHNQACQLSCAEGYISSGDALCFAGQWQNTDRKCTPAPCKVEPAPPKYGKFEPNCAGTITGGSCQLQCETGYVASAPAQCNLGIWTNPVCNPAPCVNAPALINGYFNASCVNVAGNGGKCKAGCNSGYKLINGQNALCMRGVWAEVPQCAEADCVGQPEAVAQATWGCNNRTSGAWCSPQCASGYEVVGNGAQCMRGAWIVASVVCQPAGCPAAPAAPANGQHAGTCAGAKDGAQCSVMCNNGFIKQVDTFCRSGSWVVGGCIQEKFDDCRGRPVPNPSNGQYDTCVETPHLGNCALNCASGFTATGPAKCNKGVWTLSVGCTENPCAAQPSAGIEGGSFVQCNGTAVGSVCNVQCDAPFVAVGQAVCARGSWDISGARCVHPPCTSAPKVQFGSFPNCAGEKAHGAVCDLVCQEPYWSTGQAKCADGTWILPACAPPKCKNGPINPSNGQFTGKCEDVDNMGICSLSCAVGYSKTGDATCVMGQWRGGADNSPLPSCVPRGCDQPPTNDIEFGDWDCTGAAQNGDSCAVDCDDGYTATGSATCSAGQWKNTDRKCVPKPCVGSPAAPIKGQYGADCVDEPHGATCKLICEAGYEASVDAKCNFGVYSTGSCIEQKCLKPPQVSNGEAGANCDSGLCEVLCKDGYGIVGAERLARCVAGSWVFIPDCQPLPCATQPNPIPNGAFQCRKGNHMDVCQLGCNEGYTKSADVICRFGQWTGQASCEPNGCPFLPEVGANGTIRVETCQNKKSGESCELLCDSGYVKDADFVCHQGRWSKPTCHKAKPNDCNAPPTPNPANGQYDPCTDVADAGICELECNPGFTKTQDAVCNNGTWALGGCNPNPCPKSPTAVPRGQFADCVNVPSGQVCNLQCDNGMIKRGDAVCLNGNWDISNAICDYPACQVLPSIKHGVIVNCTGVQPHGTHCDVKCDGNYTADGDAVCVSGTYRIPTCVPPKCVGLPDEPKWGKYGQVCANSASGAICPLDCQAGFSSTGSAQCNNGQWSGIDNDVMPYCEPKGCMGAPQVRIPNGMWDCKMGVGNGDICELDCDEGFTKTGDAVCLGDAWTQTAQTCQPKACLLPPSNPPHGNYTSKDCTNIQSGGVCKLWCDEGYQSTGDAQCRSGQWSLPACNAKPCIHPPPVSNGDVDPKCTNVNGDGGKCAVKCSDGYKVESSDVFAVCQAGSWAVIPVCQPQGCDSPPGAVPRGKWQCSSATHNGGCALACEDGYDEVGSAVCTAGRWTGSAQCVEEGCDTAPLPVKNGTFAENCAPAKAGSVCVLTCESGAVKSEDARCVAGEWSQSYCHWPEPNDCIAPPTPDPTNGDYDNCTDIESGKECRLTCDSGFTKTANALCNNGTWTLADCMANPCGALPRVANGFFANPCANAPHGQSCELTCDVGYEKLGNPTCRLGQWDYANAICIEQRCLTLPAIENGQTNNCNLPVSSGHSCNVTCAAGYDAEEDEADCIRGTWRVGRCIRYCANSPSNPDNGQYAKCDGEHDGEECDLACNAGYKKTGDAMCRAGQWTHMNVEIKEMPKCNPAECTVAPAAVQFGTWSTSCANGAASGTSCTMTCSAGYKKTGDGVCNLGVWSVVTCEIDDPCLNVKCAPVNIANATCYEPRCNKGTGQCENIPVAKGVKCDDNDKNTNGDECDGKGNCYGWPDMCEEVECPYAMTQCQNDGTCDPKTGECVETYKAKGTPCDDGKASTVNDMCDGSGNCAGKSETGGLPYVGAYGKWGWTCCLVMTLVMDGPVSAIQLTATDDIADLSAYHLDISSGTQGVPNTEVTLPQGPLKAGSTFTVTSNMTRFISFFNTQPTNYSEGLADFTGQENIRVMRVPQGSGDEYLIDYYPPTNSSTTYDWEDGLAYRTVYSNWILQQDVFNLNTTLNMPWGSFQLFGTFNAACVCQKAKADRIDNGKAMCRTAASSFPVSDFQDPQLVPGDDFGAAWHFIGAGLIEAMDGKWRCTVTP